MVRNPEATRQRIFDAAADEFARHGVAGARVDRIAKQACANKQLIYAYFGSKQGLFDAVITQQVALFHQTVQLDPSDVPAFAGAAFDFFTDNPAIERLGAWHALEPGQDARPIEAIRCSIEQHVRALRAAQAAGLIDTALAPDHLFAMILAFARTWAAATPELRSSDTGDGADRAARRQAVVEATRRLVVPAGQESR